MSNIESHLEPGSSFDWHGALLQAISGDWPFLRSSTSVVLACDGQTLPRNCPRQLHSEYYHALMLCRHKLTLYTCSPRHSSVIWLL